MNDRKRVGSVKTIYLMNRPIKLIVWRVDEEPEYSMTLRQLTELMDINYRPQQLLKRVSEENYCYVEQEEFESATPWDYNQIFEGKNEYLVNQAGLIEITATSKKQNSKDILKKVLKQIKILDHEDVGQKSIFESLDS